ncbi:MAG: CDP-alcohol phosphatidyltransferase [Gammaproteobacteria bacterium]|nr:CDP-alcohol phosphatidyltransferase [Gammaproteobacteria bacterium]NIR83194.1 CDP-alcohol phosphatidyltransferase [Gammaproteobacteria bacterium]NIR91002.1 CDP-alcohol phosphatidyltransferase [Gammaproteobacteria bacterium]NIU04359.1 CDP-alcohol phosphatidyltransferase [Gammaproteobacteria bacterium]NIV52582.1 CDP-alcohol phosphatidyltransferase [Gammaproteobacteria bacterium]
MTPPILITLFRFASAPVLLVLAWQERPTAFVILLAAAFVSDALDGYLARRLGYASDFGAKLDSLCDLAVYITIPLGAWWLWPELVRREAPYFATLVACFVGPGLAALAKFGRLATYHTWLVKAAVFVTGSGLLVLFAGGPAWPFHAAVPVCVLAALEEVAITWMLPEPRANVPSLWHAMRPRH